MFIYEMLIGPIELIINWVYVFIENTFPLLGAFGNIYFVSVAVNLLSLPLYNKAELIQKKEAEITKHLEPSVKHIKKTFKGNEQFMMLQALYRENSYHPLYTLRGSLSILIEIPIFIAAYRYLNNILCFDKDYFWIFKDASLPDGLFKVTLFGHLLSINVLPIVMTAINYVSGYIYTRNSTKREKIQVYVLGAIFLVLLYNSPSGLVFYWILNNLFSLGKNIAEKCKHTSSILCSYIGLHIITFGVLSLIFAYSKTKNVLVIILGCILICYSMLISSKWGNGKVKELSGLLKNKKISKEINTIGGNTFCCRNIFQHSSKCFTLSLVSGLGLTLLLGLLLPSNAISSSPEEFSFIGTTASPLSYIKTAFFVFLGSFVIWPFLIYKMFGNKTRFYETLVMFVLFISNLFNALIFKGQYGFLTRSFYLEDETLLSNFSFIYKVFPVLITIILVVLFILLVKHEKLKNVAIFICISLSVAELGVSLRNIVNITKSFKEYNKIIGTNKDEEITPILHLSKTGKNIITIFSDRAPSSFFPRVLEEDTKLKEQFKGFTYYPNTLSFGAMTIVGVPSMLGGYEYTPEELNKRNNESHLDKHNEASFVLPRIMLNNNYDVTVLDPPLPNLSQKGDLSAYKKEFGNTITVKEIEGKYTENYLNDKHLNSSTNSDKVVRKELQNFVVLEVLYPTFRKTFNSKFRSKYFNSLESFSSGSLEVDDLTFADSYSTLYYLKKLTSFDGEGNQYIFLGSNITHNEVYLDDSLEQPTDIKNKVNLKYQTGISRIDKNYNSYFALMEKLGEFFDYLRENEVYDNTRIVITSDHGLQREIPPLDSVRSTFNPTLLFKDFKQNDNLLTDNSFMTSADTPLLVIGGISNSENLINPYTKKPLQTDKANGVNVYYAATMDVNGTPFRNGKRKTLNLSNGGYRVSDDLFDKSNWIELK